ncbi:MAG: PAS domain-containing protein, partial [Anaerolineae bacterium]|nr:PAS domain-containing protein [Anaerolineae bacterium]
MDKTGDAGKTKAQLLEELQALRQQLAESRGREEKGRKRAKAALARESELLQALLDNSPDYIFFKDRKSRFIKTNKAHAQNLLGVSDPREVVGKTDFDLYPGEEENTQRFYDEEQKLMETGEPVVGREWTVPSQATGEDVWLSEHKVPIRAETGEIVGLVCIGRDITAQKQLEIERERLLTALTRQQYILDTFMDNVPDQVYFKDLESRITRANRAHATKLGFSDPAEEIGKSDFDFFPEEQARVKYEQEQEIIRTGQPILNLEEPDGLGHWALTTKMPLR